MEFNDEVNCQTCRYGYHLDISPDGWHNLCGAYTCYLCAEQWGWCNHYEEGNVPEGRERNL